MNSTMMITYVANARFPTEKAHGLQIAKTIEALTGNQVRVTLVVPKRRVPERLSPRKFYDLSCEIKSIYLPCIDWFFLYKALPHLGRFLYALETITFLFSVTVYVLIRAPAILYTRDPFLFTLLCMLRKNLFLELHTFPKTTAGKVVLRQILRRSNGIIVTNRFLQEKVEAMGITKSKTLIAPNGADLTLGEKIIPKNQARRRLGWPLDKNIALYLGHFYTSKGVDVLLEAAAFLPENVTVVFVGGSKTDKNLDPLRKGITKNNTQKVRILGFQERWKVPLFLSAADVCVLPNVVTDEESEFFTTPLKLFDYMVARRPIIASDIPALREIMDDTAALFVTPNVPQALAKGIMRILEDPRESEMRANAAYTLAKDLSWNSRAKQIRKFIEDSISHA